MTGHPHGARPRRALGIAALIATLSLSTACRAPEQPGCLGQSGECAPPAACERLTYTCSGGSATAFEVTAANQRPPGQDALASLGDFVLQNDRVTAVIDAPAHYHHLAPSGGNLLDLATRDGGDHLNQVYQITGIVPRDAVRYTRAEVVNANGTAAVIVRGSLDGDERVTVVTRYELRPCDPGVRVRTEIYNGGRYAWSQLFADAYFWGDRSLTPFVPARGQGFAHPPLDLLNLNTSLRTFPWMAAQSHSAPHTSYSTVACDRPVLHGVNDPTISAAGLPRSVLRPGDGVAFERMLFVSNGMGLSGAAGLAMDAHARLHGGAVSRVRGRVVNTMGEPQGGDERVASIVFYEPAQGADPDASDGVTPWSETVPAADGTYTVDLPAGRSFRAQAYRLGRRIGAPLAFETPSGSGAESMLADITVAPQARLSVRVTLAPAGTPLDAEIILVPTGATRREDVTGSVYGYFDEDCAPFLGPTHSGTPACNRALARNGAIEFAAPAGTYWVYASAGMETQLARQTVTLREGATATVNLALARLEPVFPAQSVSADFHVHGGRSFDNDFPDEDRVLSFLAQGVDVIATTDHDVVTDYTQALADLGASDRVVVMPGAEVTPLIPYLFPPGSSLPRTVGHFNAWPLRYDPLQPRNGLPAVDELAEPGQLFDRLRPLVDQGGERGVLQLNHPTAGAKVGRDEGYFRVVRFNPTVPLPMRDDGTAPGMLFRRPGGPNGASNLDYDTQEAAQGVNLLANLQYRAVWHALLKQGILRAGTADSDTHSLSVEPMGYPRNIVLGDFRGARFTRNAFNAAVREGRIVGTNGPYIEATVTGMDGMAHGPSIQRFQPASNAMLSVTVRAAPWVPVTEVRILVNGEVRQTIPASMITQPADAFGTAGVLRYQGTFSIAELLRGRDGYIVVEAGMPLPVAIDENNDGLPDRVDGNGDGRAEEQGAVLPAENDPRFHVHAISPGLWPLAFTNPFVIDFDGAGWEAPGL